MFKLVEKNNTLAVHGIFDTRERAIYFLSNIIPVYISSRYYTDKTLTKDSFKIVEDTK